MSKSTTSDMTVEQILLMVQLGSTWVKKYPKLLEKNKDHPDIVEALAAIEAHYAFDPFDFVKPCEPDCSTERHAYHKGQWDMAVRMNERLNNTEEGK